MWSEKRRKDGKRRERKRNQKDRGGGYRGIKRTGVGGGGENGLGRMPVRGQWTLYVKAVSEAVSEAVRG